MNKIQSIHNTIQAVVLQPTPFCNINCRYCYLPHRTVNHVMTTDLLTHILQSLFSSSLLGDDVTLIWHCGEPLVVPLDFYRETLALVHRFNRRAIKVSPTLQTNAMLITQPWCDFINQHNIRVGVSLDGPQHIHDASRIDRAGRGTFERTMQGVHLLQKNGIEPSVIMVLTKDALAYPDEIWQFFQDHQLTNLAFNVEEVNGIHTHSSLEDKDDIVSLYKHFLLRILELRATCVPPPFVREIDTFLGRVFSTATTQVHSQENIPGILLSFDYSGNLSTFSSELLGMPHPHYGDFLLGNLFHNSLENLLMSPKLLAINNEVQRGVDLCRTCHYFDFCGGGSPANKLSEHGTFAVAETLFCKLKIQATMDVVLDYLEARNLPLLL